VRHRIARGDHLALHKILTRAVENVPVLIDLDVAPPPARPRPRPDFTRPIKQAFLAVVVLLLGGAATPAPPEAMVKVADTGGQSVTSHLLTTTALYLLSGTRVGAVPLTPGGPRWTSSVRAKSTLSISADGSTIAVLPGGQGRAVFLDARTGQVRWRAPDLATIRIIGNRVALWVWVDDQNTGRLWVADIVTGRTLWARPSGVTTIVGDERRVVSLDEYGRGTVLGSADGSVLAADRKIGFRDDNGDGNLGTVVLGDQLVWWTSSFVAAYRLPGLTPLWRARAERTTAVVRCGPLLCATGEAGTTAIDPVGGQVRWTNTWWLSIDDDVAVTAGGRASRLDLATGKVLDELGPGGPAGDLLLRVEGDRSWATGRADGRVLGMLPPVTPQSCTTAGAYLACPTPGNTVTVWAAQRR
jgi:hypothetical protein